MSVPPNNRQFLMKKSKESPQNFFESFILAIIDISQVNMIIRDPVSKSSSFLYNAVILM